MPPSPGAAKSRCDGKLGMLGLTLDRAEAYASALRAAAGSPVGPIGEALAAAMRDAGRGGADAVADVDLVQTGDGAGFVRFRQLSFVARSGARLLNGGGDGIVVALAVGRARGRRRFRAVRRRLPRAPISPRPGGAGRPRPGHRPDRADGGGRRAARAGPDRLHRRRRAAGPASARSPSLDGPFGGGRVSGLLLPLSGRFGGNGGFALGEACVAAGFRRLQFQSLAIGPTRLSLCPVGGAMIANGRIGAELRAPRLAGRLGGAPIALAADRLRFGCGGLRRRARRGAPRPRRRVSRLDAAGLGGRSRRAG